MKQTRAIALLLALAVGGTSAEMFESTPMGAAAATGSVKGKVVAVSTEKRLVTIQTPEGSFEVIQVPPEVRRLDQVKIGDTLSISVLEAVVVDLRKGPYLAPMAKMATTELEREPGIKPAGTMTETVEFWGRVESVDAANGKLTVRGTEGPVTLTVGDRGLLADVAVGDGVKVVYVKTATGKVE